MKTMLAASAVAALAVLGAATPAHAGPPEHAAQNTEAYWEALGYGDCHKYELPDGSDIVWLPGVATGQEITVLVLKAGSGSGSMDVILYPYDDGYIYQHSSGKDISHMIYCIDDKLS